MPPLLTSLLFSMSGWQGSYVLCFALTEAVAALDQVFQSTREAGCRSAVDQVVIEAQCYTEIFSNGNVFIDDPWFLSDTTQGEIKGMVIDRDAPASALPNIPTAETPTVPPYFFCTEGDLPFIHQKIGQKTLKNTRGSQPNFLRPSQACFTAFTWAALIS